MLMLSNAKAKQYAIAKQWLKMTKHKDSSLKVNQSKPLREPKEPVRNPKEPSKDPKEP